ncbi:MAG: YncE family protein [Planctomycetota bacterium]
MAALSCCLAAVPAQGGEGQPEKGYQGHDSQGQNPQGQDPQGQDPQDEDLPAAVRAERCYQLLLAEASRPEAMHVLWQLQRDALPVLSRAVRSKDLAVVQAACAVLHEIGGVAAPVREILIRERRGSKGDRRLAYEWALHAIEARGFTFATWNGELLFVDDDGEIARTLEGFASAWDVQTLPGARMLLTQVSKQGARELDGEGKERRAFGGDANTPLRGRRLWNGNTLISDSQKGLTEFDPTGKVVWRHETGANCMQRLFNGHTLFATGGGKLVEIDRDGKTVRSVDVPDQIYGMRRLPDGNTLLATRAGDGVVLVGPEGKVIKQWQKLENPSDAMLLEDGSILICGSAKAALFDPDGKERWSFERQWVAGVCRGGVY